MLKKLFYLFLFCLIFPLFSENNDNKRIIIYMPVTENLFLYETPDINGNIIVPLHKGEKLELIEIGKTEIVNKLKGKWIKVFNEINISGWCFNYNLKEIYNELKNKIDFKNINNVFNLFINDEIKLLNNDIAFELKKYHEGEKIEIEGLTGALFNSSRATPQNEEDATATYIIINVNDEKQIEISAFCVFKKNINYKINEKIKVSGILKRIDVSNAPNGYKIMGLDLIDCKELK